MPSEYCGNVEAFPDRPRFYGSTRLPIRKVLAGIAKESLESTLVECGWFMDYFLKPEKSHMRPVPDEFPIDLDEWTVRIRGTGDEIQSWTLGREVGKAVVELCAAKEWVSHRFLSSPLVLGAFPLLDVDSLETLFLGTLIEWFFGRGIGTGDIHGRTMGYLQRSRQTHGGFLL